MKKRLALLMALVMVFSLCCFSAPAAFADGKTVINVMSFTDEVPNMINRYVETHPDFADKYEINTTIIATTDGRWCRCSRSVLRRGRICPDICSG